MSLNWKEIDKIIEELDIEKSHLQSVKQYDFHHLILSFYKPGVETDIMISIAPTAMRICKTDIKRKALPKPPRFTQYLKAHLVGAKLISFKQIGSERVIKADFHRGGEDFFLFIRLWGSAANIILTDKNLKILDAFSRRKGKNEIPGKDFIAPIAGSPPPKEFFIREYSAKSLNSYIDNLYYQKEFDDQLAKLRKEAEIALGRDKKKLLSKKKGLAEQQKKSMDSDSYKKWGDMIMASAHAIPPKASSVELEDWDNNDIYIKIPLDKDKSATENGEKYYQKFQKAKRRRELLAEEEVVISSRLKALEKEQKKVANSCDLAYLKSFIKKEKVIEKNQTPGLQFLSGSYLILVGRNAKENDTLLRKHVRGNDMWLHTRDWPGGYVFIKTLKGKSVPLEILLDAANLAIHYSKAKSGSTTDLHYTEVKYLKRTKNGPLGLVIPTQEKNLSVKIDESRIKKLFSGEK